MGLSIEAEERGWWVIDCAIGMHGWLASGEIVGKSTGSGMERDGGVLGKCEVGRCMSWMTMSGLVAATQRRRRLRTEAVDLEIGGWGRRWRKCRSAGKEV